MTCHAGIRFRSRTRAAALNPIWLAISVPAVRESDLLELHIQRDYFTLNALEGRAGECVDAVNLSIVKLEGAHEPVT